MHSDPATRRRWGPVSADPTAGRRRYREAQHRLQEATRALDDLCAVLAGEDYQLQPGQQDGDVRLMRWGEP